MILVGLNKWSPITEAHFRSVAFSAHMVCRDAERV
jgi:hypothetical protein